MAPVKGEGHKKGVHQRNRLCSPLWGNGNDGLALGKGPTDSSRNQLLEWAGTRMRLGRVTHEVGRKGSVLIVKDVFLAGVIGMKGD